MSILFPNIAKNKTDFVEIESWYDDIECDVLQVIDSIFRFQFISTDKCFGVVFDFACLEWQFCEMLISLDIECVIHEEDENISFDMDEHLCGEMKIDHFELGNAVHVDGLFLVVGGFVFDVL